MAMADNALRVLLRIVDGENAIFKVTVPISHDIADLKGHILQNGINAAYQLRSKGNFLGLYMVPIAESEPSIDALFISSAYTTLLFQMTVSDRHPVSFQGVDKIVNNLPAKARKDICIVFVIPARGSSGEAFRGIQSIQPIDTPQLADNSKVKEFTGFPHSKDDMDREPYYILRCSYTALARFPTQDVDAIHLYIL
ncbi:hypothetical protein PILCRDRAFT_88384 [Piloderma croceum F 1598]|uniref:Uncharacterized protein n=1 Tax=Piloderma croceum (strain F 1598) TaxID=765440 RepID=A0A0C3BZA4_PILCF|nr:hypothetical protein PILCRDRAFT_88384 [Piloderma croceum F 1598]